MLGLAITLQYIAQFRIVLSVFMVSVRIIQRDCPSMMRCRSEPLWEGIQTLVDMHTPLSALEDVAYQVVASMKLHPKLFGGDYRVWFENTTAGFKKELAVWFNHSSSGTAAPQQATLLPELPAICCILYWRQELKQLGHNCWVLGV